jgi:hypothetical protein
MRRNILAADLDLLAKPVQFLSRSLRPNQSKPKSPARSKGATCQVSKYEATFMPLRRMLRMVGERYGSAKLKLCQMQW